MPQCQFLFSAVFVFQKSCTGNILGIARDKNPISYFSVTKPEPEGQLKGDMWQPDMGPVLQGLGPRLAFVWPYQVALGPPLRPYILYREITLGEWKEIHGES